MAAIFDLILAPQRAVSHQHTILQRGIARPQEGHYGLRLRFGHSHTATA
jgi:hypothetical protein